MTSVRIFIWSMILLTVCEGYLQTGTWRDVIRQATVTRRIVAGKDSNALLNLCQNQRDDIKVEWREDGIWTDVCPTFSAFSALPRFWKLEVTYKYQLLFKWEIPITVTIVILA